MFSAQGCDARLVAEIEEEKLHDAELERKRVEHERTEKAYLRYKHAMEKESLKEVEALTYFTFGALCQGCITLVEFVSLLEVIASCNQVAKFVLCNSSDLIRYDSEIGWD